MGFELVVERLCLDQGSKHVLLQLLGVLRLVKVALLKSTLSNLINRVTKELGTERLLDGQLVEVIVAAVAPHAFWVQEIIKQIVSAVFITPSQGFEDPSCRIGLDVAFKASCSRVKVQDLVVAVV